MNKNQRIKSKKHSFEPSIATELNSVEKAILLDEIAYWCEENRIKNINYHFGFYWTFNSANSYSKKFSYLNKNSIKRWIKQLEEDGWIYPGNFNKRAGDQTKWHTINVQKYNDCIDGFLWTKDQSNQWILSMDETIGQNDPVQNDHTIGQNDTPIGQNDPTLPPHNPPITPNPKNKQKNNATLVAHRVPDELEKKEAPKSDKKEMSHPPVAAAPFPDFPMCDEDLDPIEKFSFQDFWDTYGMKLDRAKCEAKWSKLKKSEIEEIERTLSFYISDTVRDDSEQEKGVWRRRRKNPLTYLNGKTWKDYADATGPMVKKEARIRDIKRTNATQIIDDKKYDKWRNKAQVT